MDSEDNMRSSPELENGTAAPPTQIPARKRKHKPGRKALLDIRKYQRSSDKPVIPKQPFKRLTMELMHNRNPTLRLASDAADALREMCEQVMTQNFAMAQTFAVDLGQRSTISLKDFRVAANILHCPERYGPAGIANGTLNTVVA